VSTAEAITDAEADLFFADLIDQPALALAVSGGPDSTALLWLVGRWRKRHRRGPKLLALTIDHGLRREAQREAAAVKRLAARLGVAHRTLRWTGAKPATGLQELARAARYRLLAAAAKRAGATCVLTAHTLDDQAETILFRLARGSGLAGLAGMARVRPLVTAEAGVFLVRPLLEVAKARLVATVRAAGITAADDPSNRDPRFTRTRLRALMPALAREGLDAGRFALLARRMWRADAAIELAVAAAAAALAPGDWPARGPIVLAAAGFTALPAEVALRLLGRAVAWVGDEGPVELGKLEALVAAMTASMTASTSMTASRAAPGRFRRTLAGAVVTAGREIVVERAPPRRIRMAASERRPPTRRNGKKA
jgi:tRNA(Ile)-lysidine synthase